jgi:hypothetical protein
MENNLENQLNINEIINSNNNIINIEKNDKDDAFSRLHKLQLLLKKESALKELCKMIYFLFLLKK